MKTELTQSIEDYLEAIYSLKKEKGYAKVRDIALNLSIKPSSVSEMLKKLQELGFIEYEKYGSIVITKKGKLIGKKVRKRHETIEEFLKIIMVPGEIAKRDACEMEHNLNKKTVEQLSKFVAFVKQAPPNPKWLKHFKTYCKKGRVPECDRKKCKES